MGFCRDLATEALGKDNQIIGSPGILPKLINQSSGNGDIVEDIL